jgi:predicted acyltransferase
MVGSQSQLSGGTVAAAAGGEAALSAETTKPGARLTSLDAFRGMTIASMMLVNNAGNWEHVYAPLRHASWNGWTFTDTVFPFFIWISGVSMTFSFAKRVEAGADRGKLLLHTLRRALLIFLLGMVLNGFPYYNLATIRIPGVLQRIAICYFFAGLIFLYTSRRVQTWLAFGFLVVYWALMMFVPVPGGAAGVLEKEGNLAQYIDSLFLSGHMYSATKTWDPEGILSTLPAISTALFGVLTGHLLRSRMPMIEKTVWLFVGGNILMFAGVWWDNSFPINKNLWTSSYTLLMAGMAAVVFGCCYWLIDVKGYRKWARPLVIYGSNAIAVYVLAGLIARIEGMAKLRAPIDAALNVIASPINASLLHAIGYVLLLYGVAWVLHRKGWFLRV